MRSRGLVALFLICVLHAPASFGNTSEETEDVNETPSPTPIRKASAAKGEPQIDLGGTRSTSPRPDGASIAKPPSRLSSTPGVTASGGRQFIVAIDVGHSKTRFGAVSARGVTEYE